MPEKPSKKKKIPSTVLRKNLFLDQVDKQIKPESGAIYQNLDSAYRLVKETELFEATRSPTFEDLFQDELKKNFGRLLFGGQEGVLEVGVRAINPVPLILGFLKFFGSGAKQAPALSRKIVPGLRPKKKKQSEFTGVYLAEDVDLIMEFIYFYIQESADVYTLSQSKTKRKVTKVAHRIAGWFRSELNRS